MLGVSTAHISYGLSSAASCSWSAEFFNDTSLSGSPVARRCDAAVDFDWGSGSPDPAVRSDYFSGRWTRVASFVAGSHTFSVTGDDGIRLYVDGALVIDGWKNQSPTTYTADVALTSGEHTVVVEYYEANYGAVAKASW